MWLRKVSWPVAIATGSLLGTIGFFFRVWLLSVMLGEDLWVYLTIQMTELIEWGVDRLVDLGIVGLGVVGQPSLLLVQILAALMVVVSNVVYLFTVHLAGWLLFERLGTRMPPPPQWVQVLLDE
jgi:uncharacterized protein YybS (DUF2232 family)